MIKTSIVSGMSLQQQLIKFINIARQHPTYFINLIEKQLSSFINDKEIPLSQDVIYQTNQGRSSWIEAAEFLKAQKSISVLQYHQGLSLSAQDHAKDLAQNGIFGHTGSDGSTFSQRILRYCRKGHGSMAELIGADFNFENRNHAEMTILGLIIDDGVPDRGHRKTIFNPSYQYIGCKSQLQGQKVISILNITENKLTLRTESTLSSTGNNFNKSNLENSAKSFQPEFGYERLSQTTNSKFRQSKIDDLNRAPLNDVINPMKLSSSSSPYRMSQNIKSTVSRKLCQKKQFSRTFYEQGSKISQTTTQLIYNDGTMQQKINRHTVYLQN